MSLKEFAVPFGLMCMLLWVWLFRSQPVILISAFLATVVSMVAIYRNEDIVQMVIEPRRVLFEMQRIEKSIFAKVEEVRRLAEHMGELTAFNIAQLWRFAPADPKGVRLQERDRLAQMLKDMGITESRIQEITSTITKMVVWDLTLEVWRTVPREIFSQGPAKGQDSELVRQKLTDLLLNSEMGRASSAARTYLEPLGGWTEQVSNKIGEFEEFRRTGKLPGYKTNPAKGSE